MKRDLLFYLPPIDEKKTKEAVENILNECLMYKLTEFDRKEATITQSYTAQESQRTNVTSDQTANVALYNVQEEERRKSVIRRVERAVETKLNFKQRQLIKERYLTAFGTYDRDVYYGIMEISPMTYSKIREQAFLILAATLGIYVKKEESHEQA